jgi:hypothetical protein
MLRNAPYGSAVVSRRRIAVAALALLLLLLTAAQAEALSPTGAAAESPPNVNPELEASSAGLAVRTAQSSVRLASPASTVLVYRGNGSYDTGYANNTYEALEQATGRSVESATSLLGLGNSTCVILQLNNEPFDAGQTSALQTYMQQGGVVIGVGEYSEYDWAADATYNALAASVGASLSLQENTLDGDFHETSNIGSSKFSTGVTSLSYAATAGLTVGTGAHTIASTVGGVPFIGEQAIGSGALVLLGDSNVLSDESGGGYSSSDNGTLAQNLCGGGSRFSRPWPARGYGYSFENQGMDSYAANAGLHPSDVLVPSNLAATFADWRRHTLLDGSLPGRFIEELEALTGLGTMGRFWSAMKGGTCFGLALSGGRFADQVDSVFSPGEGRSDATWNVGSGPSASMLLPKPAEGESSLYNEQFLQIDANDFVTQFSTEVQRSWDRQRSAFANASTGVTALREQLESVMGGGDDLYGPLSSAPDTNFAMITLMARDSQSYGHEVLAYSFEEPAEGALKIDVWDNNFPDEHHYILVNSDGTWDYGDAPYAIHDGYRYFGSTYSLRPRGGYSLGNLYVLPVFNPAGLHLYPGSGSSIVDVGAEGTAVSATDGGGEGVSGIPVVSGEPAYAGESFIFETGDGSLDLTGANPSLEVRGADAFMSLTASGATHVTEDSGEGVISGTGGSLDLSVVRDDVGVVSEGMGSLGMSDTGGVSGTADASGHAQITVEFDDEGELGRATLFSGATTPGTKLVFTAAEVETVQGGGSPPGAPPGSPPTSTMAPPPSVTLSSPAPKCKKGWRRKKVGGKVRCVKRHHRRHHHR